jgi:hypothetical protein
MALITPPSLPLRMNLLRSTKAQAIVVVEYDPLALMIVLPIRKKMQMRFCCLFL